MGYNDQPPTRRGDDDLESFTTEGGPSSFTRTSNGTGGDLLGDAFGATEDPHYAAPPANPFTDGDGNSRDEDNDGNDNDGEEEEQAGFAERTSQIVSEYRDYLQDLDRRDEDYSVFSAEDAANVGKHINSDPPNGENVSWLNNALQVPSGSANGVTGANNASGGGGNGNGANRAGLEVIEEDSSIAWPEYPGLHNHYEDDDDYDNESRRSQVYRNLATPFHERRFRVCVLSSVLVACFFGILVAVATGGSPEDATTIFTDGGSGDSSDVNVIASGVPGENASNADDTLPDALQPLPDLSSDIYIRPPTVEEDIQNESQLHKGNANDDSGNVAPVAQNQVDPDLPEGIVLNVPHSSYADESEVAGFYKPLWFGRNTGWSGSTHMDAVKFCGGQAGNRFPCPYPAYCPDGPGEAPLHGIRGSDDEYQWSAMTMLGHGGHAAPGEFWVGVGPEGTCLHKREMHGEKLLTEESTRWVMCCVEPPPVEVEPPKNLAAEEAAARAEEQAKMDKHAAEAVAAEAAAAEAAAAEAAAAEAAAAEAAAAEAAAAEAAAAEAAAAEAAAAEAAAAEAAANESSNNDNATPPTAPADSQTQNTIDTNEHEEDPFVLDSDTKHAQHTYEPTWLDHSQGWSGMTFIEASNYCREIIPGGSLCPYEAYCPSGPGKNPYPVGMPEMVGEQWVPASNPPNTWVLVGLGGEQYGSEDVCKKFVQLHGGEQPLFGLTGDNVEKKQNIMCCTPPNGDSK